MKKILIKLISAAAVFFAAAMLFIAVSAEKNAADVLSFTVSFINPTITKEQLICCTLPENDTGESEEKSYYDIYDRSNLILTVNYTDGTSETVSGGEIAALEARLGCSLEIYSDNSENWSNGDHTVSFTFAGKSSSASCKLAVAVTKVKVEPMYDITPVYHLDGDYRAISASDGSVIDIFAYDLGKYDYNISVTLGGSVTFTYPSYLFEEKTGFSAEFSHDEEELSVGKHTGRCTVGGVSGEFTFEIVDNNIKNIQLYFSESDYSIRYPNDFYTTSDSFGDTIERPLYDRSKIMAKITYTNGNCSYMKIGELCAALHDELIIDDTAIVIGKTNALSAKIKGKETSLTLTVNAGSLPSITGLSVLKTEKNAVLSWRDNANADYYIIEKYNGSQWTTLGVSAYKSYTVSAADSSDSCAYRVRSATNTENGLITSDPISVSGYGKVGNIGDFCAVITENDSIKLSWSKNILCSGYIIDKYENDQWIRTAKIPNANVLTYTVKGLSKTSGCKFRICAFKSENGEEYIGEYSYAESVSEPDMPQGLSVKSFSSDSVHLTWNANKDADGYLIEICRNEKWSSLCRITDSSITEYKQSDLASATEYSFRIKAYKMSGEVPVYSTANRISACTKPSAVSGLSVKGRAADALRIGWAKDTAVDGYIIEMYKNNKWVRVSKITSNAVTEYRQSGLAAATVYKFRVSAYKISGTTVLYGEYSVISIRTNPSMTTGIYLKGRASNALRISWAKNESADGYIIEMYKNNKWVRVSKITSNAVTEYRQSGLAAGTAYKFRVRAYKMSGSTALYGKYANISARTNPSSISNLKLLGKSKSALRLGWTKNTSADGYIIEMYSEGKWVRIGKITDNTVVSFRKSGLASGTTYRFRVKAYKMSEKKALYSGYTSVSASTIR